MDLNTVTSWRSARTRDDLLLAEGETFLGGGSWMFSEPQVGVTGLVDLTTMDWAPWVETPAGVSIAATCTIADLLVHADGSAWATAPLFRSCAEAFLMSFKIWSTATVGGNLCLALPAGAMISLTAALGADVVVWTRDGVRREPVSSFVTGPGTTTLAAGEVVRSVEVPVASLQARTAFRKIALTALGRSSSVVIGRLETSGRFVLTVTAATPRPVVLDFVVPPSVPEVVAAVEAVEDWYDDAHGAPDWRAAVTRELARQVCEELLG
ncbi:MAG: molybdopterin dehydrogenase FAD-binding protein [Marmoricola sp.]|nr:molybdopterin dehydrogenase FAD-binding protein [Marmoricola sp.]